MKCSSCEDPAVYKGQGQYYCRSHFLGYVEDKVFKTIRKYELFKPDDKVCVATSGGKDSLALLYLVAKYCRKRHIDFFALAVDEGIDDYRDHTLEDLKILCTEHKIPLHVVSFKEKVGDTLDNLRDKALQKIGKKPCTVCGVFRRTLLNRGARELGATKIATGHNTDDEAQTFLMNLFFGNMQHNAALGPVTGLTLDGKFVPRVKPLYFIHEKETRLFCLLKKFRVKFHECPNIALSFRAIVRDDLNMIEDKLPGAKNGVINSFLEILPLLKEHYKGRRPMNYCEKCGDPCSGKTCNACLLIGELCVREAK